MYGSSIWFYWLMCQFLYYYCAVFAIIFLWYNWKLSISLFPTVYLLFRIILIILFFFCFYLKLKIVLWRSLKNCVEMMTGIVLNLYIALSFVFVLLLRQTPRTKIMFKKNGFTWFILPQWVHHQRKSGLEFRQGRILEERLMEDWCSLGFFPWISQRALFSFFFIHYFLFKFIC